MSAWTQPRDADERALIEAFEANFERLREESGRSLAPFVKEAALVQVLLYARRLRDLADEVTETEVRLVLPDQRTPSGRRYTLEGVVDIVEDGDAAVMYDLKTFLDADAARAHVEPHYRQLNVYAHIWAGARAKPLDKVALIALRPPPRLARAVRGGDAKVIEAQLAGWDPVLPIEVEPAVVAEVIDDFGRVVDLIEGQRFAAPPLTVLQAPARPNATNPFAQEVCLNCDGRFGCPAYRQYARSVAGGRVDAALRELIEDMGSDTERDDWRDSGLAQRPHVDMTAGET